MKNGSGEKKYLSAVWNRTARAAISALAGTFAAASTAGAVPYESGLSYPLAPLNEQKVTHYTFHYQGYGAGGAVVSKVATLYDPIYYESGMTQPEIDACTNNPDCLPLMTTNEMYTYCLDLGKDPAQLPQDKVLRCARLETVPHSPVYAHAHNTTESSLQSNTVTYNHAPQVSTSDFSLPVNTAIQASAPLSATDADDPLQDLTFKIYDGQWGPGLAFWSYQGGPAGASEYAGPDFVANMAISGGINLGENRLQLQVTDIYGGESPWERFQVATIPGSGGSGGNLPPAIQVGDFSLTAGDSIPASSVISAVDPNGDQMSYDIWDANWGPNLAFFELDGQKMGTRQISQAEFNRLLIKGGSATGENRLWIQANDINGAESSWTSFQVMTTASAVNAAPVVTVSDVNLGAEEEIAASSRISVTDADGDQITTYQLYDGNWGPNRAHWSLDGQKITSGDILAADFARLKIRGGTESGDNRLQIRAVDARGAASAWVPFQALTDTSTPAANTAPVVTVSNLSLSPNEDVSAASRISVTDADGDEVVTYKVYDGNWGPNRAHWSLDGEKITSRQLTAAEFSRLKIKGGTDSGDNRLQIQVIDSRGASSAWISFQAVTSQPQASYTPSSFRDDVRLAARAMAPKPGLQG